MFSYFKLFSISQEGLLHPIITSLSIAGIVRPKKAFP